jgi:phosphatidylglycerol lysyltransferase
MDAALQELVEEYAFRYGRAYDSYLVVELNRQYFWGSNRSGLISFVRQGRYAFVIGGMLGPPERWSDLLAEFLEFCKARRWRPGFFNVDAEQAAVFREAGFEVTKAGEDAIIDLAGRTWKGKDFEWVRRQSNFCQRQGLVVSEVTAESCSPSERAAIMEETQAISRDFLRSKPHGGQMRYFVGKFNPANLGRRRLFIARAEKGAGRIEGFLLANPAYGGDLWAFEMFRQRHDAVRGVVPFLMHQAMLAMQKEKTPRASLCMIPALNCQAPLEGDSKLLRWFMRMSRYLGPIYDLSGMYHFKSRFRPRFEGCYFAAYPKATLWMLRASLMVWGADRINPFRLAIRLVKHFFRRKSRATLAQPVTEEAAGERSA